MPKLRCPCGHVHDLSPIPDAGWVTGRDDTYEALLAAGGAGDLRAANALTGRLYGCPHCGRLLWERPGEDRYRVYAPEPLGGEPAP